MIEPSTPTIARVVSAKNDWVSKLLLVRIGNIRTRDLKALFKRHLPEIVAALQQNSLVKLDRQTVRVVP